MRQQVIFGIRLHYYRIKCNITQENLGRRTGLHRSYISALERGRANPSLTTIHKLAEALEIADAFLLMPVPR